MKTAVEWYNAKLNAIDFKLNSGLINYEQCKVEMSEAFEQAKEMEKKQIETAFEEGMFHHTNGLCPDEYYNETFKSE